MDVDLEATVSRDGCAGSVSRLERQGLGVRLDWSGRCGACGIVPTEGVGDCTPLGGDCRLVATKQPQ